MMIYFYTQRPNHKNAQKNNEEYNFAFMLCTRK